MMEGPKDREVNETHGRETVVEEKSKREPSSRDRERGERDGLVGLMKCTHM